MVIVKRKELSFRERLYLPEIARALSHSFRAIFQRKVTRQYPEEALPTNEVTRGQPRLVLGNRSLKLRQRPTEQPRRLVGMEQHPNRDPVGDSPGQRPEEDSERGLHPLHGHRDHGSAPCSRGELRAT